MSVLGLVEMWKPSPVSAVWCEIHKYVNDVGINCERYERRYVPNESIASFGGTVIIAFLSTAYQQRKSDSFLINC